MTAEPLEIQNYTDGLESEILDALHAGFGRRWGTIERWRWKHRYRPGFRPADINVFMLEGQCGACFHVAVRTMCLGPNIEVGTSTEGDFVVRPQFRGRGLAQKYFRVVAPFLAQRGVVLRGGFSSPELYQRFYRRKFGHCLVGTVNAHYRKILSDVALRAKLTEFGEAVGRRRLARRVLAKRPVVIRVEIAGFEPCELVLERGACACVGAASRDVDLVLRAPYLILTAARMRPLHAFLKIGRGLISGEVRVRGVMRLAVRCVGALLGGGRS